ncbi:TPR-like protein [Choiromyces venosus 120613-1]|uniref:TPR-like protein n=1 Tax=Choiromyces venosus 120613-1 TaxID=1336337 RepID=A0A3N4J822_9PEZI|nr:TPR-like protein [Choiromyces venosus 120613-1]
MLERVALRLESGGWRLLRGRLKKRMLHSAFWVHGAGELGISPANMFGFGFGGVEVDSGREDAGEYGANGGSATKSQDIGRTKGTRLPADIQLDFLYPSKTLAFLRHLTLPSARDEREILASRTIFPHGCKRLYSSKSSNGKGYNGKKNGNQNSCLTRLNDMLEEPLPVDPHFAGLSELRSASWVDNYDSAWYHYSIERKNGTQSDRLDRRTWLMKFLKHSSRIIDKERIVAILLDLSYEERTKADYKNALRALLQMGYLRDAIALLHDQIERSPRSPVGFVEIMTYCIRENLWDVAIETLKLDNEVSSDDSRLNLPAILQNMGNVKEGPIMEFAKLASSPDSKRLAQELMVGLLQVFLPPKESERFWKVWELGRSRGLFTNNQDAYTLALIRLYREKRDADAVKIYLEYREIPVIKPNPDIFNGALRAFRSLLDFRGMQMVFDDWFTTGSQPDKQAYYLLMAEMARHGEAGVVRELLDQFLERFNPEELLPFNSLMFAHARRGELEEVVKCFDAIPKFGFAPDNYSFNILINAYAKAQDVDGALQRVQEMIEAELSPDTYTYGVLMTLAANRGDIENTKKYFDLAVDSGAEPTEPMYLALMTSYVTVSDLESAENILGSLAHAEPRKDTTVLWNELLSGYAVLCDPEKLNMTYHRMREAMVPFDQYTYAILMHALCLIGKVEAAEKVLDSLEAEGIKPNSIHYAIIMVAHMKNMDLALVWATFNRMVDSGINPTFTTQAVLLQASAFAEHAKWRSTGGALFLDSAEGILAQVTENLDVLDLISRESVKSATPPWLFAPLVSIYGKEGSYLRSQEVYQRFLEIAEAQKPGGTIPSIKFYIAIMNAHMKARNIEAVKVIWDQVRHLADKLARPSDNNSLQRRVLWSRRHLLCQPLSILTQTLIQANELETLVQVVADLEKSGYELDNVNWNNFVHAAILCDDLDLAMETFETKLMPGWIARRARRPPSEMPPVYPFSRTFDGLAAVLKELDNAMRNGNREAEERIGLLQRAYPITWRATTNLRSLESRIEAEVAFRMSRMR